MLMRTIAVCWWEQKQQYISDLVWYADDNKSSNIYQTESDMLMRTKAAIYIRPSLICWWEQKQQYISDRVWYVDVNKGSNIYIQLQSLLFFLFYLFCIFKGPLRKHANSNILKISPPKDWKFSAKNSDIFSYFCSKHRLGVLVRTASARWF